MGHETVMYPTNTDAKVASTKAKENDRRCVNFEERISKQGKMQAQTLSCPQDSVREMSVVKQAGQINSKTKAQGQSEDDRRINQNKIKYAPDSRFCWFHERFGRKAFRCKSTKEGKCCRFLEIHGGTLARNAEANKDDNEFLC